MIGSFQYELGLTACAQVSQHGVDTVFVDQAQSSARYAQTHPTVFALDPETTVLQVRQETTFGFVVSVGNIVPGHGAFARYFTYACHLDTPVKISKFNQISILQKVQAFHIK
jgi:hypothetical protein